jgi:hypothetical protein
LLNVAPQVSHSNEFFDFLEAFAELPLVLVLRLGLLAPGLLFALLIVLLSGMVDEIDVGESRPDCGGVARSTDAASAAEADTEFETAETDVDDAEESGDEDADNGTNVGNPTAFVVVGDRESAEGAVATGDNALVTTEGGRSGVAWRFESVCELKSLNSETN